MVGKASLALFASLALGAAASADGVSADRRVLAPVPQQGVRVGGFWRGEYRKLAVKWLPHCIRQMEKGGRGEELLNLAATAEINAGRKPRARFKGCPWSDAYPYNVAESICLALEIDPGNDPEWRRANDALAKKLEEWIALFLSAQEPSGYIHSFHALRGLPHFSNPANHEFYVMGYFIELGVAHMRMTKGADRRLFDAAVKCADHIASVFGPPPKRTWFNGHPGIEYALCRLADAVDAWDGPGKGRKYALLARHFVRSQHLADGDVPWNSPCRRPRRPAWELSETSAHAVCATYFYTGMAAVGSRLAEDDLAAAASRLFSNAIDRKEYITGGVGANPRGEEFGPDFWLPLYGYSEACAACGMNFWCTELHAAGAGPRTEDVRERLLYNLLAGAISNDGVRFLYSNPPNGRERHYPWHWCPCCIGNIPRALLALKDTLYAFARDGKTLYVDHFMDSECDVTLGGKKYRVKMSTAYPDNGDVELSISPAPPFAVVVRFPDRAESPLYTAIPAVEHGYREIKPSADGTGARYAWSLPMPYQTVTADRRVEACRGRKAYQRGPTVYSWEGAFGDTCVPFRDRLENGGFSAVWKGPGELSGGFALHTCRSTAEFRDIEIVAPDGAALWKGLPDSESQGKSKDGRWSVRDGAIAQSNPESFETELPFGGSGWRDCIVRFKARRTGGREGFIFHVRHESPGRTVLVNLGGWNNTQHAIEVFGYACYAKEVATRPGALETGRWYAVEIACRGDTVGVKLDGKELFKPVAIPPGDFNGAVSRLRAIAARKE